MKFLKIICLVCAFVPSFSFFKGDADDAVNASYFIPYERGFVGVYGEPSNFQRERVNEGAFENPAKELIYGQDINRQVCPGMVGPFTDGNYYCTAKEYGYCDRRSGICFCNMGYQGIDCSECTPNYFKVGSLCYPKKLCPDDCSGAGRCDYWTGTCHCLPHRVGANCATQLCKTFNDLCVACSNTTCLRCPEGYYLTDDNDCNSCFDFDPRCAGCTKDLGCTLCADPILTSVRRSGYRASDPRVPVEEDNREFSITLPFGTKSPESFAEAEAFIVAATPENALRDASTACHQGYSNDESWHCEPYPASHIVCGHKGVFSFRYPNYVINETSVFFRVSVVRSGGGYGNVLVNYFIKHYTTSDNDVAATAPYTTSQTLLFEEGIVERSFLIRILDDNVVEENEVFQIVLEVPEGGGSVGPQFKTNVTIVDDDLHLLSPIFTKPHEKHIGAKANEYFSVLVQATFADTVNATTGGERFLAVVENDESKWIRMSEFGGQQHAQRTICEVIDNGNGTYSIRGSLTPQGSYQLRIWHAFPGGLLGTYFRDAFMENIALQRIDRNINFTWGVGRLLPRGADYITIRWTGAVRPDTTDDYYFKVVADDHARLWVDGQLLMDHWHEVRADLEPYRVIALEQDVLYEIELEYREVRGEAFARLMWTSATANRFEIIPPDNLYSLYEIGYSPIEVTVTSGATSAPNTECTGEGLYSGVALHSSSFQFCPRDVYSNFRDDEDDWYLASELFNVSLTLINDMGHEGHGREIIWPVLQYDKEAHCFIGTYTPERAGIYELNILHMEWHGEEGNHVAGSPFVVVVAPDKMNGPNSAIVGIPSPLEATAGHCYDFTIISKDGANNLRLVGGENVQVYMFRVDFFRDVPQELLSTEHYDPSVNVVRYGTVIDENNGNYSATICPVTVGWYEVHVMVNGFGVSNIPFRVQDKEISQGEALGGGDSTYLGQYIDRSPYRMYVQNDVAVGGTSSLEVYGGLLGSTVGVLASFMITLRDGWKNVVRSPSSPSIVARFPLAPRVPFTYTNLNNGSYLIEYVPEYADSASKLDVLVNGGPIVGSPFSVPTSDGAPSANYTYAEGSGLVSGIASVTSSFLIFAYDLENNRKTDFGDEYVYITEGSEVLTGRAIPCVIDDVTHSLCNSLDQVTGTYVVEFVPTVTGYLTVHVYLNASGVLEELRTSPHFARIFPHTPSAEKADVSGTLYSTIAGKESYIHIHLRDVMGNKLESGGHDLELLLGGVAGDWGTIEPWGTLPGIQDAYYYGGHYGGYPDIYGTWVDHMDGSYTASYTLSTTGVYVIRLSVAEIGLNATYYNDTNFGYLVTFNDNLESFDATRKGAPVNQAGTVSWTGDIGGNPGTAGDLGDGSYFHRFKTRVEDKVDFDLSTVQATEGNVTEHVLTNTAFTAEEKYREEYWSVRYMGLIIPEYPEIYIFSLVIDQLSEAVLRIGGLGANTNQSQPGDVVLSVSPKTPNAVGQYEFTDTKMREFVLEYKHFSGPPPKLSLLWESPSTSKTVIPPSAFRHWRNISHYNLTAHPDVLCSSCSTAYGEALHHAVVGDMKSFVVYGRDRFGNLRQVGDEVVTMVAVGPNGVGFRGQVTDYGNSTYMVEYYATQSGRYRMYVTIGCCPAHPNIGLPREIDMMQNLLIAGTPFLLTVEPGVVDPSRCVATGKSIVSVEAGDVHSFDVLFRDLHNNPTDKGSDNFRVEFEYISNGNLIINQHDNWLKLHDGYATVTYNITLAGEYRMSVLINDQHILSSPFRLYIRPSAASAVYTDLRGMGLRRAFVDEVAAFEMTVNDRFRNDIRNGGDNFYIRLVGSHSVVHPHVVIPSCVDNQNGKYSCTYTPKLAGRHDLIIKLLESPATTPGGPGLVGRYFLNSDAAMFLDNVLSYQREPQLQRTDKTIDFSYPSGFHDILLEAHSLRTDRTLAASDFASGVLVTWTGYLVSPVTDTVMIMVRTENFNASVYVDDALVFNFEHGSTIIQESVSLQRHAAYELRVTISAIAEAVQKRSFVKLMWSSILIKESVIPSFYMYDTASVVPNTPFLVNVTTSTSS